MMPRKKADLLAERILFLATACPAMPHDKMVAEAVGILADCGVPVEGYDRIEFDADGDYRFFSLVE